MREDRGEIEAAARGQIPGLVRENDPRGDLHTHTDLTDGVAGLEAMVAAGDLLASKYRASVGDFFVDTVVLYDPDHVLLDR
jgi:DNA polymerase (family 10)